MTLKVTELPRLYRERYGLTHTGDSGPIDYESIGRKYLTLEHKPNNLDVIISYTGLVEETERQARFLENHGIHLTPWDEEGQPYSKLSEVVADIENNGRIYFFRGGDLPEDHPLNFKIGDFTANEVYRAVHDVLGHAASSSVFTNLLGELRAYRAHTELYTPITWAALFTEIVGQISAFYLSGKQFPTQKAGIVEYR